MVQEYVKSLIDECITAAVLNESEDKTLININEPEESDDLSANPEFAELQRKRFKLRCELDKYEELFKGNSIKLHSLVEKRLLVLGHVKIMSTAFSDLITKFEKTKMVLLTYKQNREILINHVQQVEETIAKIDEKYHGLKAYVTAELGKANTDVWKTRKGNEEDIAKYATLAKGMEIRCNSEVQNLKQKTQEFDSLTALLNKMKPTKNKMKK